MQSTQRIIKPQQDYKKVIFTIGVLVLASFSTRAQTPNSDTPKVEDPIYKTVEVNPTFPDGIAAFQRYLAVNLIVPNEVKSAIGLEYARAVLAIVIEMDGTLSAVEVVQGVQEDYDELLKNALRNGPKWIPARQNGVAVRFQFILPITMNVDKLKSPR